MAELNFGRPDGVPLVAWVKNGFKFIMDAAQTEKPLNIVTSALASIFSVDKDGNVAVAGNLTVTGSAVAAGVTAVNSVAAVTADGAITVAAANKDYFITKAGVAAMTIVDPTTTTHDGVELTFIAATANAHTLSNAAGSGFFSSGGATKDVATFGGAIGDRITIIAYQGKWYIKDSLNITLG